MRFIYSITLVFLLLILVSCSFFQNYNCTYDNHMISYDFLSDSINYTTNSIKEPSEENILNYVPKGKHIIENVPVIPQFPDYPTGCEAVTAVMALNYMNDKITVDEFIDVY